MTRAYHSETIQFLKSIHQRIPPTVTTVQLMTTLDDLLYRAVYPVLTSSSLFDIFVPTVIAWASMNSRRRLSSLPKHKFLAYLTLFLLQPDARKRLEVLKKCRIERNLLFSLVGFFLERTKDYQKQYVRYLIREQKGKSKLAVTEYLTSTHAQLGLSMETAFQAIHETKAWYTQALEFRSMIAERYYRLVVNNASMMYNSNPERYDIEDIAQNFLVAVHKAIDKCDHRRGTLTSYVQKWILDAKTSYGYHEYGISYVIPKSKRLAIATKVDTTTNNLSMSMEDDTILNLEADNLELDFEKKQMMDRVRILARHADPIGFARMKLGIKESLTQEELASIVSLSEASTTAIAKTVK